MSDGICMNCNCNECRCDEEPEPDKEFLLEVREMTESEKEEAANLPAFPIEAFEDQKWPPVLTKRDFVQFSSSDNEENSVT